MGGLSASNGPIIRGECLHTHSHAHTQDAHTRDSLR